MAAKPILPTILFFLPVGIVIAASAGGWWYFRQLLSPVNPADRTTKVFVVTKGESFADVANDLTKNGLIRSPYSLRLAAYRSGQGKNIQAGSFRLSAAMTPNQILETLAHGKLDMWVTLLEGWRREEIADGLAKTFADNNSPFDRNKFLAVTQNKEGHLFPDTYLFPLNTDETTVASILESTLDKKMSAQLKADIAKSGHSLSETLTMASIIEREARTPESRRIVAGILWKRLAKSWPLQVDATLQFAKGYDRIEQTWWGQPAAADKNINSPYNTYKNPGLPPGPICAPSLGSIEAAVHPTSTNYWYYITDMNGQMHYAETIEQHNQNVATYLR